MRDTEFDIAVATHRERDVVDCTPVLADVFAGPADAEVLDAPDVWNDTR